MRRTTWMGVALLVGALVVAQTAALTHASFDDAHPADASCAFCIGLADYAGGNVGSPHTIEVSIQQIPLPDITIGLRHSLRLAHRLARGPPIAS